MNCDVTGYCELTLVNVRSALSGPGHADCSVDHSVATENEHRVRIWNLGTGRYVADAEGGCEEPLRFRNGAGPDQRAWRAPDVKIGPQLKEADGPLITWGIAATGRVGDGVQQREVTTSLLLKRRFENGQEFPMDRRVPANELTFSCSVK
jgi:hypothetical protein